MGLVVSRKAGEGIVITVPPCAEEQRINVRVYEIRQTSKATRLHVTADKRVIVNREEVQQRMDAELAKASVNQA